MKKIFPNNPLARLLFRIARVLLLVYVGFTLYLAFFQRRVLYYPMRAPEPELVRFAERNGLAPWRTEDSILMGWQPTATIPESADIMLVFHGNAGFALHRTYLVEGFQRPLEDPAFYVFLFEYPGYGARAGSPSETNMRETANQAVLQLRRDFPGRRIWLAGESLGSGVAAWLAGEHPDKIAGLFLMTAFNRLVDVARHHYPVMPVHLLLRDRYEAARALEHYRGPVGILLAGNDNVVPAQFGKALYESYQGPKRLWIQDNRNHNTLDYGSGEPWWQEVKTFLLQHAPPPLIRL
ncbi:MAG: alpha/beta hydrolase [Kiritimatiellia bacterium]